MRALWSDRPNCSHNVSQKVKRIRRVSDSGELVSGKCLDGGNIALVLGPRLLVDTNCETSRTLILKAFLGLKISDLFSRRCREGISFPNFVERSIPKLALSKLRAVPCALQNRALFEGEKRAKRCREKGKKRDGQRRAKRKKGRLKTGQILTCLVPPQLPESRGERILFHGQPNLSPIFREIFCAHFSRKLKDENRRKISPFFRRIFRPCR